MTRQAKLKNLTAAKASKKVKQYPLNDAFAEEFKKLINEMKAVLDVGVEFNNVDDLLEQLTHVDSIAPAVDSLKKEIAAIHIPTMPKDIEIKGLQYLVKAIDSSKVQSPVTLDAKSQKHLERIVEKLTEVVKATNSITIGNKTPNEFIPVRRVMKVGNRFLYDDSFVTGSGGGGSSIPTKNGSIPVVNPDGSNVGGSGAVTNDGTFAKETGGNLDDIDAQLDKLTFTGNRLQVDAVLDASEINIGQINVLDTTDTEINPAKEDGNLASIKIDLDEIVLDTDHLATIDTSTAAGATSAHQTDGNQKTQVTNFPTTQPISGTVTETNSATIKSDLDEIALDTDNLALIKAKTDNLDTALSGIKTGTDKIISAPATAANQATEISNLQALNSLTPSVYDYISLSYTGSDLTGVVFKTGGSGGSTVSTLTLAYSSNILQSVTKT